ncbi:MAG: phytanoyl-CoA dioxygenase family protein [Alphaproteobacteria bacterium]|nr:phytanoyl-CoA dioxygenase family protein [Alphaproteobacteria bacterium]
MLATPSTYTIAAPDGRALDIPATVDRDHDPYPSLESGPAIRRYYEEQGYVVVRVVVPTQLCDDVRRAFADEVKPYRGFIYRQTTGNPERHEMTAHGHVLNPVLNIQDLSAEMFPRFRSHGLAILTHGNVQRVVEALFGMPGKIVQTMYFEGNPATWAHQDTYYLDAEKIGRMAAAWIAVEDINPGAGRFYVYPRSHLIDIARNGGDFDIAFHHDRYKSLVLDLIDRFKLECRAPALAKGDVLFWNSKTIHGSLETRQPEHSRSSFTAHWLPLNQNLLQFQSRVRQLDLKFIDGVAIHHPKDLNVFKNRAVMFVETTFPAAFRLAKKVAIKAMLR